MTDEVENKVVANTTEQAQGETPATEDAEQINWKKFREDKEKLRREKEESERKNNELAMQNNAMREALEAALNKTNTPMTSQEKTNFINALPKDQFITGGELEGFLENKLSEDMEKKLDALIDKRERKREKERQDQEVAQLPTKLKSNIKDFDQVCSAENLDYLEYHHPEIARAFAQIPNTYEKWSDIYSAVKKYVPNSGNNKDQRRSEANLSKPKSISTPGVSTVGDQSPRVMSEDVKKANWERMQKQMKGIA